MTRRIAWIYDLSMNAETLSRLQELREKPTDVLSQSTVRHTAFLSQRGMIRVGAGSTVEDLRQARVLRWNVPG